jgi:hypothetical protein
MKWIRVPKRPLLHTRGRMSHFGPFETFKPMLKRSVCQGQTGSGRQQIKNDAHDPEQT